MKTIAILLIVGAMFVLSEVSVLIRSAFRKYSADKKEKTK